MTIERLLLALAGMVAGWLGVLVTVGLMPQLFAVSADEPFARTIGLPVREPMLASGEIDALFAFGPSTAVSLQARGVPGEDIVLMDMAEHGLLLYGSAVIVSGKLIAG